MRRVSYLSVILFIIAAWFTVFFFWNFIEYNNHVRGIMNTGSITFRGNAHEIVGYYMSGCAPYAFYALVTGVLGWLLIKMKPRRVVVAAPETSVVNITNHFDEAREEKPKE
ncbi:MAG: hypothetical protein LBC82_09435 [Oscillospiraceae bacterium]|jgi:lysylphosphatidylglycerol synthetase-like protein (DUF2156 family)|nr:hypothetical protein [Oscillospiraceae bacterium]